MRPVTAGRVGWVVMPGKEFWPLLCHPCSLMSSSRKQKDSPTEKNVTMAELGQVLWMVYLQSSSLMWKKKKPSLTEQAELSTAAHCISVIPQPWMPTEAVKRSPTAPEKQLPSAHLPHPQDSLTPVSNHLLLVEHLPVPRICSNNDKVWSTGLPRDLWHPCRELQTQTPCVDVGTEWSVH